MTPLHGKHALVTGASRGIGAAIARRLANDGATVTLLGRNATALASVAAEINAARAEAQNEAAAITEATARVVICDVTNADAVRSTILALPRVDILINNAGQAESAPVARTSEALWSRMLAVNLTAPFVCTQAVLPRMLDAGWGRVVTVASTAALRGYPYVAAYAAAKHGVVGFTRSLALEVATRGVTVNAVCPGYTDTDLLHESVANIVNRTGRTPQDARAMLTALNPQGRFVAPDDVANAVTALCAPAAAAITGVALSVSGGEVM